MKENNHKITSFGIHVTSAKSYVCSPYLLKIRLESFVDKSTAYGKSIWGSLSPSKIVCSDYGINFLWESRGEALDENLIHWTKMVLIEKLASFAFVEFHSSIWDDFSSFEIDYDLPDILLSECQFEQEFPDNRYKNSDLKHFLAVNSSESSYRSQNLF